jgi:hypothetical protein
MKGSRVCRGFFLFYGTFSTQHAYSSQVGLAGYTLSKAAFIDFKQAYDTSPRQVERTRMLLLFYALVKTCMMLIHFEGWREGCSSTPNKRCQAGLPFVPFSFLSVY